MHRERRWGQKLDSASAQFTIRSVETSRERGWGQKLEFRTAGLRIVVAKVGTFNLDLETQEAKEEEICLAREHGGL
jgi:hypothetical protein